MNNISGNFYPVTVKGERFKQWIFIPNELTSIVNHIKLDVELVHLLTRTHRLLGILEGTMRNFSNIEPFLQLSLYSEAQKSCAVDGIMADIDNMLQCSKQTEDDIAAENYYNVLKCLHKMPVTTEELCRMHKIVMKGITQKQCGKIWTDVFLMHPEYSTNGPEYNPPLPEELPWLLEDLERFIRTEFSVDFLIKLAAVYYQFEAIHPFECANGRIGRILILQMLMSEDMLSCSFLSVSSYFLERHDECFRQFIKIQHYGQFAEWIRFFINGIAVSSENTIRQIEQVKELRKTAVQNIRLYKKPTETLVRLYDFIELNPITDIDSAAKGLEIAYNTAAKNIGILQKLGILKESSGQRRYRVYRYEKLMRIFY